MNYLSIATDIFRIPATWGRRAMAAMGVLLLMVCIPVAARAQSEVTGAIQGFLDNNCIDCHSSDSPEAGFNLEKVSLDLGSVRKR